MLAEHRTRTLAHQLVDILAVYADSFDAWCAAPSDVSRYERAHASLDLVRVLTAKTFPGGRGELGELLLAHADVKTLVLKRHIAHSSGDDTRPGDRTQLHGLLRRHAAQVAALRAVCRQRSGSPPPTPPAPPASRVERHLIGHQHPVADL